MFLRTIGIHDHVGHRTCFKFYGTGFSNDLRIAPIQETYHIWQEKPRGNAWWTPPINIGCPILPWSWVSVSHRSEWANFECSWPGCFSAEKRGHYELYPYLNTFKLTLGSTNMAMEDMERLKMYFRWNMWVSRCHVSEPGCLHWSWKWPMHPVRSTLCCMSEIFVSRVNMLPVIWLYLKIMDPK